MTHQLLLVEDDIDLGNVMKQYLEVHDFKVMLCRDGEQGWQKVQDERFDLCILDIMLPEMDGFTLAQKIKRSEKDIPFIFLTAKNQKNDRMKGLQLGADDYITKPFEIDELVLRVQNILKRLGKTAHPVQQIGSFRFNRQNLSLQCNGIETVLTVQEAKLLQLLVEHKNKVVPRPKILTQLWGEADYFNGRSLDVFITRLRKYLKTDPNVKIENRRGVGFLLKVKD